MTQLEELHKRMNERKPCDFCRDGHTVNEEYEVKDWNCIQSLERERNELKATVAELRALLSSLEFVRGYGQDYPMCPECRGDDEFGHKVDCRLAEALNGDGGAGKGAP